MNVIRFKLNDDIFFGELLQDKVCLLKGNIESGFSETGKTVSLEDIELLAPVAPTKVVCVGLNYADHVEEVKLGSAEEPVLFLKPPSSIIANNENIVYPKQSKRVDYEGELAIVIKKTAKNVAEAQARDHIFGYTCANDVTARDLQAPQKQWTIAKGFDTFLPIGPSINTNISPDDLMLTTRLNGEIKQQSSTKMLIRNISWLVSYISSFMTLEPGDVILTGTPAGIAPMEPGDIVEVEIEGIGKLVNKIVLPN